MAHAQGRTPGRAQTPRDPGARQLECAGTSHSPGGLSEVYEADEPEAVKGLAKMTLKELTQECEKLKITLPEKPNRDI